MKKTDLVSPELFGFAPIPNNHPALQGAKKCDGAKYLLSINGIDYLFHWVNQLDNTLVSSEAYHLLCSHNGTQPETVGEFLDSLSSMNSRGYYSQLILHIEVQLTTI